MIEYFARHPTAANLLMMFLMVIGLFSLPKLQRETFPDFSAKEVEIRIPYPGASTADVEEGICQRVEDALDIVNEVAEVRCVAQENISITVVEMVEAGDIVRFMDDVKTEIEAIDNFPENSELPIIKELGRTAKVVSIAITGPMSTSDLKLYAEQVKSRMQQLREIKQVNVLGFSEHQLRIEVPQQMLQKYQLSMADISSYISRQSIDLPAGSLKTREQELLIRFTDLRRNIKELEDLLVVSSISGAEIRLGDIANITDRFEFDEDKIIFNNQRAAILEIIKTKQQDTLTVNKSVMSFINQEKMRAAPGVRFDVTEDRSTNIKDRLSLLMKNGLQGLILVFLVMLLFFPTRFAFWVSMGLPVSFLGALFMMQILGLTINMITMVALLIAIGLLMDDAIVIAENVASHLHKNKGIPGKNALSAAIDGTKQVSAGVLSSFLTTISVFTPLAFLSGNMGQVLQFIPMVLILVLAVSLLEAFLILPHHLAHALKDQHEQKPGYMGRFRQAFDVKLDIFREKTLGSIIQYVITRPYLFIGLVVALFIISIAMPVAGKLKFKAFPDIEGDVIEARLLLPQGTPLWRTEEIVKDINTALQKVDKHFSPLLKSAQKKLITNIKIRYNNNMDANETGSHLATIIVDLITAEKRSASLDEIIAMWREEVGTIPDIQSLTFKEPVIGPGGQALEIRLYGAQLDQLKQASLELQAWLSHYQGVIDLSDNLRAGKIEVRLQLRPGALSLGVDASTIASQLRSAFFGSTAQEIQLGKESYEVDVRLADEDKSTLIDLENFRIINKEGEQIPLKELVEIEQGRGFSRIERINGQRSVTVIGDVDPRFANSREIINHTKTAFLPELLKKYPAINAGIEGESKDSSKTASSMITGFSMGLIGIFILLSFQFKSYREPLVVMAIIPLALIGVIWGHLLMGLDLTMPGIIGFASLSGIVVNDSIILVEFIKLKLREGLTIDEAAISASKARFRAVLITSVTTIAGLFPLLLEKSMQAQILIPLATSIIFGLFATTFLVLLVVPVLYRIIGDTEHTTAANSPP
ncbi:MAG: efflux RND transporter permease subunit [Pseudomonadota bacterium]